MDPVQAQLEAYNARDIDAFIACYAVNVVIEDGQGNQIARGREQMHADYGQLFAQFTSLNCTVKQRMRVGAYVIDEEIVTGRGPEPLHVVAIYRVESDQIVHVRFLR